MFGSVLIAFALAAPGAAPASGPGDTKTKVDAVFQEYDRSDLPGCVLGVYQDGRIVYARGYGLANLELGVANSAQTVFDIGSTSKQFTAFSIQLLARDGKLSLDDDVRKWIPEIPDYGKTVTIRNLLHHTGGLRDYIVLMELQGVKTEDLTTDQDTLAILARQKAPNFAPGEENLYSNTGYFLLSVVVRRASGQSLRDFAAERIFEPLGMRHTQYNDSHTRILPNRATGYSKAEGGGFGIDMSDWEQTGDGAVLTTVEDLQRWDQNFYEPKVGDAKLIEAMQTVGVLNSGKKLAYASALVLGSHRGLPTVAHGGSWAGYRAQLLRFPQQHFSIACLCNNGGVANPSRLAYQVAEVYLGGQMKKEEPKADPKKPERTRLAVSLDQLKLLGGAYRNPVSGQVLKLSLREKNLVGGAEGQPFTLVPIAPGQFRLEGLPGPRREAEVEMVSGGRPRIRITTTYDDGEQEKETFEPVELWSATAEQLGELAGTYASDELDTAWRLVLEKGKLIVHHRGITAEPLTPTVSDVLTLEGMNLAFTRDAARKVTGFKLDAGRVRGIVFARLTPEGAPK